MKVSVGWTSTEKQFRAKHYHGVDCWRIVDLFATHPWTVRFNGEWVAENNHALAPLEFLLEEHRVFTVDTLIFTELDLTAFLEDTNPVLARAQLLVSLSRSMRAPLALTVPEVSMMAREFAGADLHDDSTDVLHECLGVSKSANRGTLPIWNLEGHGPNHFPLDDEFQRLATAGWLHTWGQYTLAGLRQPSTLEFEVLDWRDAREVFSGKRSTLMVVPDDLGLFPFVSYAGLPRRQTPASFLTRSGGGADWQEPEKWDGGLVRAYPVLLPRRPSGPVHRPRAAVLGSVPLDIMVTAGQAG